MRHSTAAATAAASLAVFPLIAQAQEFDVTHCYVGTATVVFASDDAVIAIGDSKGIYRTNGDKKLLHGFSIHCAGNVRLISKKRTLSGGCKVLDPKGDSIALAYEGEGAPGAEFGTADAVAGTGAWKGVTGGGKWQVHTPSNPLAPGAYQGCLRYQGALKVPGK
jgi:hypothetical protein